MDAIPQTIWQKLRYTPLRDALRGNLTGRMDLTRLLAESELPPAIKELLWRVCRSTRLWRLERFEVLQELIAHFADGIKSGRTEEELIREFGDEVRAAKLIRRAKRRNRPWPWHVSRVFAWAASSTLVVYGLFAFYFFTGRPSPRINYVADINREIEKTQIADRAWPLYRSALMGLRHVSDEEIYAPPGTEASERLASAVINHQGDIESIRQGASKRTLGFVIGAGGSAYDSELWPEQISPTVDPILGEPLNESAWPPLHELRSLAILVRADARLARQKGDGERALRDIRAMFGLSRQVGENAPLLWGLIATAIYEHGLEEIEVTLREDPNLLEKKDWVDLAEQLSVPKVAADFISIDKEQIWFDDMLQRSFTDDGMGNGRFTPQGMHYFLAGIRSDEPRLLTKAAVHPALSLLVPSRKRLVQQHEHLIEQASANLKVPMRSANWERVRKEMQASRESFLDSINPVSISQFADYSFVQASLERLLGRRDGLVVGIALELYRREHGMYPQTLDVLVPEYLPSVPTDRITGDPTRYRTVNGKPVVYSVGFDRDDDGGRATAALAQRTSWPTSARDVLDGDWMLFPSEYTRRIH